MHSTISSKKSPNAWIPQLEEMYTPTTTMSIHRTTTKPDPRSTREPEIPAVQGHVMATRPLASPIQLGDLGIQYGSATTAKSVPLYLMVW